MQEGKNIIRKFHPKWNMDFSEVHVEDASDTYSFKIPLPAYIAIYVFIHSIEPFQLVDPYNIPLCQVAAIAELADAYSN